MWILGSEKEIFGLNESVSLLFLIIYFYTNDKVKSLHIGELSKSRIQMPKKRFIKTIFVMKDYKSLRWKQGHAKAMFEWA